MLEPTHHDELRALTREFNDDGFRVIAVAYKELPPERKLTAWPTRTGWYCRLHRLSRSAEGQCHEAIRVLQEHGVAVKVLTGDNEAVTRNICRQVGLPVSRIILGNEIDARSDDELAEQVEGASVLAKLSPAQKASVVKSLHRKRHVVGFLGDGINDAPALKAADVGISVDTAVDVAKESADIILLEKNLLVLEQGVVEGRRVFGNITKYMQDGRHRISATCSGPGCERVPALPADAARADSGEQPPL